jgi:DNA-binding transcriptional regulator LsrR (DeoR family)
MEPVSIAENSRRGRATKIKYFDIEKIKKLYKEGYIQSDIAKKFNITQSNVSRIINNRSWIAK